MKSLLFITFLLLSLPVWSQPSRIYFFDGSPSPLIPVIPDLTAHREITDFIEKEKLNAELVVTHMNFWVGVCNELRQMTTENKPDHIIMMGHSWGVGGAVAAARCASEVPIDLIISIDTESFGTFPDENIIPTNVKLNINYFQNQDALGGRGDNHRPDGTQEGIENILVDIPNPIWPHLQIVGVLFDRNLIYEDLKTVLKKSPTSEPAGPQ